LKLVSLKALSVQARLMLVLEGELAERDEGAAGGSGSVVADVRFE
jgi:hypothetical protein